MGGKCTICDTSNIDKGMIVDIDSDKTNTKGTQKKYKNMKKKKGTI